MKKQLLVTFPDIFIYTLFIQLLAVLTHKKTMFRRDEIRIYKSNLGLTLNITRYSAFFFFPPDAIRGLRNSALFFKKP